MINFKAEIASLIHDSIKTKTIEELIPLINVPREQSNGDFSFACFTLSKSLKKSPAMIADELVKSCQSDYFDKVESVSGYLNFYINKTLFAKEIITSVLDADNDFLNQELGLGKTVLVDFSSPNIAKPFHIGHLRSTVIGNSICRIYKSLGYNVVGINHLGDYGTQFGKLIVAYRKWGDDDLIAREPIKTLLDLYTRFHQEAEKDESLNDEAREAFRLLENGSKDELALWEKFRELSLAEFSRVYELLGIKFDSFAGESFYQDKLPAVIDLLNQKHLLEKSEGASVVNLEDYGLGYVMIAKSDGSSLYATRDLATAIYRKEHYDFYLNIYVVASQQNLHFKQWKKVLSLVGYEWEQDCVHVPFGLVSLEEGTISTRSGRVVFLEDVLNNAIEKTKGIMLSKNNSLPELDQVARQVGIGAVMFQELHNNRIKDYVFSWDKVLNFDGETGPYVQYTHARACSILKNSSDVINADTIDFSLLTSDSAYTLLRLISQCPDIIQDAASKFEPSLITRHLIEIAKAFNKFYHDEHILIDDEKQRCARLGLVLSTKQIIAYLLALLGIEAPERM